MHPLSEDDDDISKKQRQSADNPQAERIKDIIDKLPAHKSKVIASKIGKFARGFKIPDDKKAKIRSKSKLHKQN